MRVIKPENFLNKSGFSFENLISKLLYEEYGEVFKQTPYTNDGGKDFESLPTLLTNKKIWAECKKYISVLSYNDITKTLLMAYIKKINKVLIFSYSPVNRRFYKNIAEYKQRTGVEIEVYDDERLENLLLKYKNKDWFSDYIILEEDTEDDISELLSENNTITCKYNISEKLRRDNNKIYINMHELFSLDILLINPTEKTKKVKIDYTAFSNYDFFELLNKKIIENKYYQEVSISKYTSIIIKLNLRTIQYKRYYIIPDIKIDNKRYHIAKKLYATWLAQTGLIGDEYQKIKNFSLQHIESAKKLNFILIEGSTGTGKSNILLEIFQITHKYDCRCLYCDIDKKKISIKLFCQELFAFFTQLPFFKNTKKTIAYLNESESPAFRLGSQILYEENYDYSNNIDIIAKCIFTFLQKRKYLLVIDNIQKYDSLSIKLVKNIMYLSSEKTCSSTIILSVNSDFLIKSTKAAKLIDSLHFLCSRKIDQYHNFTVPGFDKEMAQEYIRKCLNIAPSYENKYKKITTKIIESLGCNPLVLQNYLIFLYNDNILDFNKSYFLLKNLTDFFNLQGYNYKISNYFINELDNLLLKKTKKKHMDQSYLDITGLLTMVKEISRSTLKKISENDDIVDLLLHHGIIMYDSRSNTYLFRHIEIKHYYQQKYNLQYLNANKLLTILKNSLFKKFYIEAIFLLEFEVEKISENDFSLIAKEILDLNIDFDNLETIYTRVLNLYLLGKGTETKFNLKVMRQICDNTTRILGINKAIVFQERVKIIIQEHPTKYMSFSADIIGIFKEYLRHLMNERRIHEALDISNQLKNLSTYIESKKEQIFYINELYKMDILCLYKINNPKLALNIVRDLIRNNKSPLDLAECYMFMGNIYYHTSLRFKKINIIITNWIKSYKLIQNLKINFDSLDNKKQAIILNACIKHILASLLQQKLPNDDELHFLAELLNYTGMPYFEIKIRHVLVLCELLVDKPYKFLLSPIEYTQECLDILSTNYGNKNLYSTSLFFLAEIYKEKKDYSKMYSYYLNFYGIISNYYFNDGDIDNDGYLLIEMIISLKKYKKYYPETFNFNIMNNIPSEKLYMKLKEIYYMVDQDFEKNYSKITQVSLFYNHKTKSNYPLI